jgi:hypothetical protein
MNLSLGKTQLLLAPRRASKLQARPVQPTAIAYQLEEVSLVIRKM